MTDEEQPASEQPAADKSSAADTEQQIDDKRRYTTREAGDLLKLRWRTIVEYIRRGMIAAEREIERRGPVYYIRGAEIKRFQRERHPLGYPRRKAPPPPESPRDQTTPSASDDNTNVL